MARAGTSVAVDAHHAEFRREDWEPQYGEAPYRGQQQAQQRQQAKGPGPGALPAMRAPPRPSPTAYTAGTAGSGSQGRGYSQPGLAGGPAGQVGPSQTSFDDPQARLARVRGRKGRMGGMLSART